jgi:predicted transcriptional regulator
MQLHSKQSCTHLQDTDLCLFPYGQSTASELLSIEKAYLIASGNNTPVAIPTGKAFDTLEQLARDPYEIHRLAQSMIELYPENPKRAISLLGKKDFLIMSGAYKLYAENLKDAFEFDTRKRQRLAALFTLIEILAFLPPRVILSKYRLVEHLSRANSIKVKEYKRSKNLPLATSENQKAAKDYFCISFDDTQTLKPIQALVLGYLQDIANYENYALNITTLAKELNTSRLTIRKAVNALKEAGRIDREGNPTNDNHNMRGFVRVPKSIFKEYTLTPAAVLVYSFYWTRAGARSDGVVIARTASKNDARNYILISEPTFYRALAELRERGLIKTCATYKKSKAGRIFKTGCNIVAKQAPELDTDTDKDTPQTYKRGFDILADITGGGRMVLPPRELAPIMPEHGGQTATP